jgi:hypothetical protein
MLMNSLAFDQPAWLNSSVVPPASVGRKVKRISVSIQSDGPWTQSQATCSGVCSTIRVTAAGSSPPK